MLPTLGKLYAPIELKIQLFKHLLVQGCPVNIIINTIEEHNT